MMGSVVHIITLTIYFNRQENKNDLENATYILSSSSSPPPPPPDHCHHHHHHNIININFINVSNVLAHIVLIGDTTNI